MTTPTTSRVSEEMVIAAIAEFHRPCKGLGLESMDTKARRVLEAALASLGDVVAVSAFEGLRRYEHDEIGGGLWPSKDGEWITHSDLSATLNRGGK